MSTTPPAGTDVNTAATPVDGSGASTEDLACGRVLHGERHPAWMALFVLAALVPLAHTARIGEPSWTAGGLLLAAVPFAGILVLVRLLQFRHERPRTSRRWALLWGFLVATGASSYANGLLGGEPDWRTVVLLAPFVEEFAKGAGLLLLARFGRIRNPVDGIVYALLVGGGFSLLENTFYFFNAIGAELGGDDGVLRDVFVMRGLVSPLAHPVFVAALGVVLGTRYARRPLALLSASGFGITLHALWNHAAISGVITDLAPHIVALALALVAAALLCVHREDAAAVTSTTSTRGPGEDRVDTARPLSAAPSWYMALPWYERDAEAGHGSGGPHEEERPLA